MPTTAAGGRLRPIFVVSWPSPLWTRRRGARLEDILEYINSYYTVYSNLFLYDAQGVVLACSQAAERSLYGQQINEDYVRRTLSLKDSDDFAVSPFRATSLYHPKGQAQPTYVYSAPVFGPEGGQAVGGIGIVFDSLPQFADMLGDTLPKNSEGKVVEGATRLLCRSGGNPCGSQRSADDPRRSLPPTATVACPWSGRIPFTAGIGGRRALCSGVCTLAGLPRIQARWPVQQ